MYISDKIFMVLRKAQACKATRLRGPLPYIFQAHQAVARASFLFLSPSRSPFCTWARREINAFYGLSAIINSRALLLTRLYTLFYD